MPVTAKLGVDRGKVRLGDLTPDPEGVKKSLKRF
jgi:hypothetical protein